MYLHLVHTVQNKNSFAISIVSQNWDRLFCNVNAKGVDDLAKQGVRASAAMAPDRWRANDDTTHDSM